MNAIIIIIVIIFIGVIIAIISNLDFTKKPKISPIKEQARITKNVLKEKNPKINPINELARITNAVLKENKQHIIDHYSPYLSTLSLKKQQLIYVDEYGDEIETEWNNELIRFIKNKMDIAYEAVSDKVNMRFDREVSLDGYENSFRSNISNYIEEDIISRISYRIERAIFDYNTEALKDVEEEYNLEDPILFEKSVAKNFTNYGWIAKETKRTGDQGADVIAEKDGNVIIVQCKLYSQAIGNKAVQEVFAAQKYYNGNLSIVVSNASYTKSAQQLAESNDVLLLHYSDLNSFLENIQNS